MFDGVPLHPLVVHAPLVLGVLAPVIALILWGAMAGRFLHHRVWWLVVFLYVVTFASAFVAVRTGQQEEDVVEEVLANHDALHAHEDRAKRFRLAVGGVLMLTVLTGFLFGNRKWGMRFAGLSVVAGAAAAWLALGVGHSGGLLVYQEGAANAYVTPADLPPDGAEDHEHD
ncbi:MAG: DUF2231 domain-containing protein [Gemmatimonadales bacterium]